jgi:pimeloyl-[acyl-carrier protein] methyl ester esterase
MDWHVECRGNGPDLVLLHGWGMRAGVWDEVATQLAPRFRVHSVDLPGYGGTDACVPYTLESVANMLAANCAPRVTVCGWSLGGQLAMRWALSRPAQIERLVLIATTPRFVQCPGWDSGMEAAAFDAFAHDLTHDANGVLRRFALLQSHADTHARSVLRRLRDCLSVDGKADSGVLAAGLQILRGTDLRAELPCISQAVLVLHGERDSVVPPAAGAYLKSVLKRAKLEVVAGAAHAPFIGRAHDIAQRIGRFCHG